MKKRSTEKFTTAEGVSDSIKEFEGQLVVDRDNLEEEVIRQPEFYYHVSEQLVYAVDLRDRLKKDLEELEAEVDNKIRSLAERNEDKITEAFVKKQIAADGKVQALNRELLDAKRQVGLWEAMKESFGQRSYAVNKLADMVIARTMGSGGSIRERDDADTQRRISEERRRRER